MAYTAHIASQPINDADQPEVIIRDDRGIPAEQLALDQPLEGPEQAEAILARSGWTVTAGWTTTSDGWAAPVARSTAPPDRQ